MILKSEDSQLGNIVLCYVDDILIATKTVDQHLERLSSVFQKLARAGLKLKPKKCVIMSKSIKYLGRIIDQDGCRPDPEAVEVVKNWQAPKDMSTLRSFLGFANYYREFIKDYAEKISPLQDLVKKDKPWEWHQVHQDTFEMLKKLLTTAPVLGLPEEDGLFILDTDASMVAIAGILSQRQTRDGVEKEVPIAFASKSLSPTEQRYGAAKLEMFAAKEFIEKFEPFLIRKPFLLRVDNTALSWLRKYSMTNALCARWIQKLEQYSFTIEHRRREKHQNADSLSKQTEHYQRMQAEKDAESCQVQSFPFFHDPY